MAKIAALAVVLAAGVAYLVYSSTQGSAEYYQTIAEMKASPKGNDRDVRVVGTVQNDIVWTEGGLRVHFTATDDGKSMPVEYQGPVPDIFKAGAQVVVQGRIGKDGVFYANELQTKCPSRFSASPAG
jgi:cytochrome c-type biogenesis protein CcmE